MLDDVFGKVFNQEESWKGRALGTEEQNGDTSWQEKRDLNIAMIGTRGIPATVGGVERHVEELATRLVQRGHRVTVYCRQHYVSTDSDFKGVKRVVQRTVMQKHLEMIAHTGISLLDLLSSRRVDIVHFQSVDPAILSFLGKLKGKVVVTSHGMAYRQARWGRPSKSLSLLAERFYVRVPQARIAVSRTLTEYYRRKYGCDVSYIPNGVGPPGQVGDDRLSVFSLASGEYILFVGRLIQTKGCHQLIEAYRKLDTTKDLAIVGDSSYTSDYVRQLRRHESDRVRFLGFRFGEELQQLLNNCYMFVMPSDSEGLAISLLEAMVSGRPVVYSDIPENVEVANGCGLSFRCGDVDDLARKIDHLLNQPPLAKELGKAGREKVRNEYDWEKIVDATESVYSGLFG